MKHKGRVQLCVILKFEITLVNLNEMVELNLDNDTTSTLWAT